MTPSFKAERFARRGCGSVQRACAHLGATLLLIYSPVAPLFPFSWLMPLVRILLVVGRWRCSGGCPWRCLTRQQDARPAGERADRARDHLQESAARRLTDTVAAVDGVALAERQHGASTHVDGVLMAGVERPRVVSTHVDGVLVAEEGKPRVSKVVFIGRDLDREEIEAAFRTCIVHAQTAHPH